MGDTATCNRRKLRNAGRKVRPEEENIGGTLRLSLRNNDVFLLDFQVDHISGNDKGNENHHVVHPGQGFALCCHIRNCNIL